MLRRDEQLESCYARYYATRFYRSIPISQHLFPSGGHHLRQGDNVVGCNNNDNDDDNNDDGVNDNYSTTTSR